MVMLCPVLAASLGSSTAWCTLHPADSSEMADQAVIARRSGVWWHVVRVDARRVL
jgi:hypothetical protein